MSRKPETNFRTNTVKPFLKTLRYTVAFPIQQMSIIGDPDLILCIRGLFVALELKARGGKVSRLQQFKLDEVKRCEGIALVASPENWLDIKALLTNLDGGLK